MLTAQKIFICLILALVSMFTVVQPSFADSTGSTTPSTTDPCAGKPQIGPISPCNWHASQQGWYTGFNTEHWIICDLTQINADGIPQDHCPGVIIQNGQPQLGLLDDKPGGAMGGLAMVITNLYNSPPTSTVDYLANVGSRMGFVQP